METTVAAKPQALLIILGFLGLAVVAGLGAGIHGITFGWETRYNAYIGGRATFALPVYLRRGDRLVGHYNARITKGALTAFLWHSIPVIPARLTLEDSTQTTSEGIGTLTLRANQDGYYVVAAKAYPGGQSSEKCRKRTMADPLMGLIARSPDCPLFDMRYRITWRAEQ